MPRDVYDVFAGDVLPVYFDTFSPTTPFGPVAPTGFVVGDIKIFKDASITQRTSTAGITLLGTSGVTFDGMVGINGFTIDTGDNTDAGFYTVGAWFLVVIDSIVIGSTTQRFIAARFRLKAAEVNAGEPIVDIGSMVDLAVAPTATSSGRVALNWLFSLARNKMTQSSTTLTVKKDNGSTDLATAAVSDTAGVFTRDEFA